MSITEPAARTAQVAYKLNGLTFVPHYRNNSIYVGPGYPIYNNKRYSAAELTAAGATSTPEFLWSRGAHGIVNEANP